METIDILEKVRQLVADGKHKEAEDFLIAHFKELPEDLQGDLLIGFIKDAAAPRKMENMATDVADAAMRIIDRVNAAEEELAKTPEGESA
jgi:hypothetical protein